MLQNNSLRIVLFLCVSLAFSGLSQNGTAYKIYTSKGKKVSFKKMMKKVETKDLIFFGELHDNPIAHWLEYEITVRLLENNKITMGAEMFEADNQSSLTEYINGKLDQKAFDTLVRLWPNYATDYAPLIQLAIDHHLPFIASNIPRRYASLVYKKGFEALDSLSSMEKSWIAPLPILFNPELPRYKNILEMMGEHGTPDLIKAQAIKDATMAYFILKNITAGEKFIHYNGAYHSDYYEGIVWYILQQNAELKITTISTVSQKNVNVIEEEYLGKADFIICVDENMTSTY